MFSKFSPVTAQEMPGPPTALGAHNWRCAEFSRSRNPKFVLRGRRGRKRAPVATPAVHYPSCRARGASSSPQGSGGAQASWSPWEPGSPAAPVLPARPPWRGGPRGSGGPSLGTRRRGAAGRKACRVPAAPVPGRGGSGDGSEQEERARVRSQRIKSRLRRAAPQLPPPASSASSPRPRRGCGGE